VEFQYGALVAQEITLLLNFRVAVTWILSYYVDGIHFFFHRKLNTNEVVNVAQRDLGVGETFMWDRQD
jgi:hypothetical protein